jgi:ribonuclease HI
MKLPDNASIFTAEAKAIDLALSYIVQHTHDKFVIFSDSLSVLISIKNKKSDNIIIRKLLLRFHDILKTKYVRLYWIPSHVGIRGNEKVDALAKHSLNFQKMTYCYLLVILDRL